MKKTIQGNRLLLRPTHPQDADLIYQRAYQNSEFMGLFRCNDHPSDSQELHKRMKRMQSVRFENRGYREYMIEHAEHGAIGLAALADFQPVHRRAEFEVGLFDSAHRNSGFGLEASLLLLDLAFNRYQLNRLDSYVYSYNDLAQQGTLGLGFSQEGLRKDFIYSVPEDRFVDMVLYGMTQNSFRQNTRLARLSQKLLNRDITRKQLKLHNQVSSTTCSLLKQAVAVSFGTKLTMGVAHADTVNVTVSGDGSVLSSPAGVTCYSGSKNCSTTFDDSTTVTLTAYPDSDADFEYWSSACDTETYDSFTKTYSSATNYSDTCTVSADQQQNVTAYFSTASTPVTPVYQLSVASEGEGSGTVTASGINCGSDCEEYFDSGTSVTLTASADSSSSFSYWSSACDIYDSGSKTYSTNTSNSCTVYMDQAQDVSANFDAISSGSSGGGEDGGSNTVSDDSNTVSDDSYEDNDQITSAFSLSSYEDTLLSNLFGYGVSADEDWYEIYVAEGQTRIQVDLYFTHNSTSTDLDVGLYDPFGDSIVTSESISDNEFIDYEVSSSGFYYIRVNNYVGYSVDSSYDLVWRSLDSSQSSEPSSSSTVNAGTGNTKGPSNTTSSSSGGGGGSFSPVPMMLLMSLWLWIRRFRR